MSKYYKAAGIRQIPDPEHEDYPLATIRTPIFNYFNIRKIEIDASFERPATGTEPFRYLICAFYYYCHTGRYCLLANIELVDMYWNRFIDMYFPKLGIDAGVCDAWSNTFPSVPGWRNDADPRGKITMTFGDFASEYHFEVERDDTKHEVKADVTASIPRMPHGSDYADEAHLSPEYGASLGGHPVDWNVPGTATKGPKLTINYCPFSIYSFKAWDKNGELVTDLRAMAITDDDGSNIRGGMYDALTNEIYEAVLRNDLGNSKFEPIDPDYSQELFTDTPVNPEESVWKIKEGYYPHIDGLPEATEPTMQDIFNEPYPTWMWRVKKTGTVYPYLAPLTPAVVYSVVKQYEYITVHDSITQQYDFDNNGLRIIMPTRCEITEELNGTYELMLEMPIDEDGAWQSIREFNIIKACGQLFTIYRVVTQFRGNEGHLVAYAKHVFYKMADWWMPPNTRISRKYFITDILSVFSKCKNNSEQSPNTVDYKFSPSSDIKKSLSGSLADYSEMTALEVIYGNGADSLLNVYGGELYRDNFRFSINEKMEGAKENGFHIRVGLNLTGIKRDVDFSDFCTEIYCYDGFGGWRSKTWLGTGFFIPNNIIRSVTFKYDPETYSYDMLIADTDAYWAQVCYPKTTFEIDKANLRDNPDYSNFSELWDTKVGDSGVIYDERLGGEIKVRVIKTKRDGRNGNVTSVVLSSNTGMWRSGTGSGVGNKVQTKQDKETQEQIRQAKIKNMGTWANLENYKWLEMGQFTWQEANGGN